RLRNNLFPVRHEFMVIGVVALAVLGFSACLQDSDKEPLNAQIIKSPEGKLVGDFAPSQVGTSWTYACSSSFHESFTYFRSATAAVYDVTILGETDSGVTVD